MSASVSIIAALTGPLFSTEDCQTATVPRPLREENSAFCTGPPMQSEGHYWAINCLSVVVLFLVLSSEKSADPNIIQNLFVIRHSQNGRTRIDPEKDNRGKIYCKDNFITNNDREEIHCSPAQQGWISFSPTQRLCLHKFSANQNAPFLVDLLTISQKQP